MNHACLRLSIVLLQRVYVLGALAGLLVAKVLRTLTMQLIARVGTMSIVGLEGLLQAVTWVSWPLPPHALSERLAGHA